MHEVAIVGGGAAGLSTAALLGERGVQALVLEAEPALGGRWARRHDRLHLHTPRLLSGLPGVRIPRAHGPRFRVPTPAALSAGGDAREPLR